VYAEGGGRYRRLCKAAPSVANRATAGVPAPTRQAVNPPQGIRDKGPAPGANAAFPERQEGVADLRRIQVLCANRALTVHATVSALEEVLIRNK
jgi:hypothetical protein